MQKSKKWLTSGGLALGLVLLFAVNVFSNATFTSSRLDLTENNLFTLTEGTRNVLAKLDEPVTLRLFLSQEAATRLPGISNYAQRVRELLEEYERQADGLIDLKIIDPEPFSESEDRAVGYGLQGVNLDDSGNAFYFGLVGTGATDESEVIPIFSPSREQFLEYDLTRLIHKLSNPNPVVVGLMSTLPITGGPPVPGRGPSPAWVVVEQLRELFEVRVIDPATDAIADDVDVLMLVHPQDLSDATLYAIDQYVLAGGRALVFVDPNAETDRGGAPGMMGGLPTSSSLNQLFDSWGVTMAEGKVAADLRFAERVRFNDQQRQQLAEYPLWMNLQSSQFDSTDVATAELGNLIFASAGALEDKGSEGITVTPLVQTSDSAMLFDISQVQFVNDPRILLRQYQPGGKPLMLAARLSGKAKSAFADGPPKTEQESADGEAADQSAGESGSPAKADEDDAQSQADHITEAADSINVIVVADVDMLSDGFWVQVQNILGTRIYVPSAANGNFVINAVESLAGSNDLISVRSRGQFSRPFTKVAEIQRDAELKFRQKEEELLTRLAETEQKLRALEKGGEQSDQALILNEAQRREVEQFRREKLRIRKELRDVRHQLRKDIENLEGWAKFANIGLLPILIGIGGVFVGARKMRRRSHKNDAGRT